jgi:4-hydroxy-tetrahydrodipicolinate reductase
MALLHPGEKISPVEFKKKVTNGEIHLVTSLPDSMNMVAAAMGWKLDEIKVTAEPIYSKNIKKTPLANIEPGTLCGFKQLCRGMRNGRELMTYQFIAAIYPQEEEIETDDTYSIEGTPNINIVIKGGVNGAFATPALSVNMIPKVINAKPGLLSMKDLPLPAAIMGYARNLL